MEVWFSLIGFITGSVITIIIFRIERKDRLKLSEQERKDKYRLAAIDKKLEVAQHAYIHWENMFSNLFSQSTERIKAYQDAYKFWVTNCLYLELEVRIAFRECITNVNTYDIYLNSYNHASPEKKEERKR